MDDGFLQQYLSLFDEFDVLAAFWVNIQLTFYAGILALILGTVLATMRISPVPSLRWAGSTYVTLLRNTPLTIIMVFCVLGLWGQLGFTLSPDFTTNFFRLAVARPDRLPRGVRVRGAAVRRQHRARRPGRGRPRDRAVVLARRAADHPAAGVPRLRRPAGQRAHRAHQELDRRGGRGRRGGRPA